MQLRTRKSETGSPYFTKKIVTVLPRISYADMVVFGYSSLSAFLGGWVLCDLCCDLLFPFFDDGSKKR